jgi:MFS transporter, DHA2 family, multidrug resistance protein
VIAATSFGTMLAGIGGNITAVALPTIAPISGLLSDRISASVLGAFGMLCASAGMLLIAFVPVTAQGSDFAWRLAICGFGFGCYFTPNAHMIISATPRERVASAGGLIGTNRHIGQTLGATLLAALSSIVRRGLK